jgi:hypothetical protein
MNVPIYAYLLGLPVALLCLLDGIFDWKIMEQRMRTLPPLVRRGVLIFFGLFLLGVLGASLVVGV